MKLTERDVVAQVERVTVQRLRLWVKQGWVTPATGQSGYSFDDLDIARIRLVCELEDELDLNEEAVAVVLSLLDQLYGIRREFKALARALDTQPEDVRATVREAYSALLKRRDPRS